MLLEHALKAAGTQPKPSTESAEIPIEQRREEYAALDLSAIEERRERDLDLARAVADALDNLLTIFNGDEDAMYDAIAAYRESHGKPKADAA